MAGIAVGLMLTGVWFAVVSLYGQLWLQAAGCVLFVATVLLTLRAQPFLGLCAAMAAFGALHWSGSNLVVLEIIAISMLAVFVVQEAIEMYLNHKRMSPS